MNHVNTIIIVCSLVSIYQSHGHVDYKLTYTMVKYVLGCTQHKWEEMCANRAGKHPKKHHSLKPEMDIQNSFQSIVVMHTLERQSHYKYGPN